MVDYAPPAEISFEVLGCGAAEAAHPHLEPRGVRVDVLARTKADVQDSVASARARLLPAPAPSLARAASGATTGQSTTMTVSPLGSGRMA